VLLLLPAAVTTLSARVRPGDCVADAELLQAEAAAAAGDAGGASGVLVAGLNGVW